MSIAELMDSKVYERMNDENLETDHAGNRKISELYIGNLCTRIETLRPDTKIALVSQRIRSDPALPGFCILDDGALLGVATRNQLNAKLSSQYGYGLYCNKGIDMIMCKDFLCVDFFTTIDIIVKISMQRDPDKIYDFITVTKGGKYAGIVTVKDLLEKSTQMNIVRTVQLHPHVGLPDNQRSGRDTDISKSTADQSCVLDFDIDGFKTYYDVYGPEKADMVMERLTQILSRNIPKELFLNHAGEADFIAIAQPADAEKICRKVVEEFEMMSPDFYTESDLLRGYILSKNSHGIEEVYPFLSITIAGVANTDFIGGSREPEAASKIKSIFKLRDA